MDQIKKALAEPSTYAALATVVAFVLPKAGIDAGTLQTIGAGLLALVGVVMREKGGVS